VVVVLGDQVAAVGANGDVGREVEVGRRGGDVVAVERRGPRARDRRDAPAGDPPDDVVVGVGDEDAAVREDGEPVDRPRELRGCDGSVDVAHRRARERADGPVRRDPAHARVALVGDQVAAVAHHLDADRQ
jgi:hypothetical protein